MEYGRRLMSRIREIMKKPRDVYFQAKLSMFLVTVALFFGLTVMSMGIKNHYVKALEKNAENLAKGYSLSLTKTVEAENLIEKMIHDRLTTVSGLLSDFGSELKNEDLVEMAEKLDVEEINIFDHHGVIIISNFPDNISWSPSKGHYVEQFLLSDHTSYIDPIRTNAITGHLVLYGYSRMDDGKFIQVGINAKDLKNLVQGFDLNTILKDMLAKDDVAYVRYLSNDDVVIGSSDSEFIGKVLSHERSKPSLTEALGIGKYDLYPAGDVYDVGAPVLLDNNKVGTLIIGVSLLETREAIRKLSTSGSVILLMIYFVAILVIYQLYRKNSRLFSLAYQDDLTALPNIRSLKRDLKISLLAQKKDQMALVLIQVPQLGRIMMSRGYDQGDSVLQEIAGHLSSKVSCGARIYRYSDEKFILVSRNYGSREDLIAQVESLGQSLMVKGEDRNEGRFGSLEFGILEVTDDYKETEEILKDMLIALSSVSDGEGTYAFFDETMENKIRRESLIENEIREALAHEENELIFLAYQPIMDTMTERVHSIEVLTRMNSSHYGEVSPLEFINIAEKYGIMVPLGKMILRKAAVFIRRLMEDGFQGIRVAVNISGIQLIQGDFIDLIREILHGAGIPASSLELEITESVFLSGYEQVNMKLRELKDMGVTISIDDFGTGYSSFARLKELNVDGVKIDKFFISRITSMENHELITGDIIRMVHKAGLFTVGEGVETQLERNYLEREGCDFLQGYYYSRPMTEEDMMNFLREEKSQ